MTTSRKTALVVGVLFILTFITSIVGELAYGPVLRDPNYIIGAGADTSVLVGALFEMFLIITNIGCAVVLFPLLKRQNETLALGYVTARLVECTFILIGIVSVLAVVTLRQHGGSADAGSLVTVGASLIAIKNWTFLLGPGFVDGIGTGLILGWLMYRSGLVSHRMALFGVIGGPLLAASGIAVLLGVIPQQSVVAGRRDHPGSHLGGIPRRVAHIQGLQCGCRRSGRNDRRPTNSQFSRHGGGRRRLTGAGNAIFHAQSLRKGQTAARWPT